MDATIPLCPLILKPLALDVPPFGDTPFETLVREYRALMAGRTFDAVMLRDAENLASARAAMLAASALNVPFAASFRCDEEGMTPCGMDVLAAMIVMEGMGAQAFGLCCDGTVGREQLNRLAQYAALPLFWMEDGVRMTFDYAQLPRDPDVIPCAGSAEARFITPDVDLCATIECSPGLLEDILRAEDEPGGALKISILEWDDLDLFAEHQYAVRDALCLWSDVPELMEAALRLYQGRAFYDGTGELDEVFLAEMSRKYGLIVL